MRAVVTFLAVLFLAACSGDKSPKPHYIEGNAPTLLSDWGMLTAKNGVLTISDGATPYNLATPLFSDYALKLRTVWTPDDNSAVYKDHEAFAFPVGTVVTKSFFYEKDGGILKISEPPALSQRALPLSQYQILETRLLVMRENGWEALSYIWNDEQTDAILKRTGAIKKLTLAHHGEQTEFAYLIPNVNQCANCHVTDTSTKQTMPIGLKARHLNKPSDYAAGFNQLDHWVASGLLGRPETGADMPANADWRDEAASLEARARAYLDINCSHCHSPTGAARTSGLDLRPGADGPALGLCKSPIAAGGGTGGRQFSLSPGAPDQSITLYRMETIDPGAMMPELGRALAHSEGAALIREWIAVMDGACG